MMRRPDRPRGVGLEPLRTAQRWGDTGSAEAEKRKGAGGARWGCRHYSSSGKGGLHVEKT